MRFEPPTITDHGPIVQNTFTRCEDYTETDKVLGNGGIAGKNPENLVLDSFGECSHS